MLTTMMMMITLFNMVEVVIVVTIATLLLNDDVLPSNHVVTAGTWVTTVAWATTSTCRHHHHHNNDASFGHHPLRRPQRNAFLSQTELPSQHCHRHPHSNHHHKLATRLAATSHRRSFLQNGVVVVSAASISSTITPFPLSFTIQSMPQIAAAKAVDNWDSTASMGTLRLRPATEDQPQIQFPDINTMKQYYYGDALQPPTTLEGLIYLKNPKSDRRPNGSDVIVISIRTTLAPTVIVAGAIVPVSRIASFPFQFRINGKNAIHNQSSSSSSSLSPQETWNNAMKNNDLVVKAIVCPRDTIGYENGSHTKRNIYDILDACQLLPTETNSVSSTTSTSTLLSGEGLAKLIRYGIGNSTSNFPLESSEPSSLSTGQIPMEYLIRAPVSVPLG